ncbi:MAG: ABC transporter ATP-binding protein [Acidobacteriota bacterium]
MSDTVIRVEGLGKKYIIGHQRNGSDGLRHVLQDKLTAPFRWLRNPQSAIRNPQSEPFWALKDVSFDVTQGEVVGIIGRNGAGKSTLLKILSRITEPTEGCVRIRGRVASLLEVGTGFHPELTGRENVFLNGAILGMTREEIKRKFDEIVAFAEVEKFLDTPVKRYSSGMYVRLAFAVAAHLEPEILIVDEVLAVGDEAFQKKCLGKMDKVAQQGRTVFFVSHNMPSIKRLCTTVILLSDGRLVERGSPDSVVAAYLQTDSTRKAMVELAESEHLIDSPLQVRTVEVLNSKGKRSDLLLFGETIFIRLGVEVKQPITGARIGIGIQANGVRVATLHAPPVDIAPSEQLQSFTCSLPSSTLLPNVYSLHVGAYRAETGGLDWVPDAIDFRIEAVSVDGLNDHDQRDSGLVRLNASWEGDLLPSTATLLSAAPSSAKRNS